MGSYHLSKISIEGERPVEPTCSVKPAILSREGYSVKKGLLGEKI